jgi:predicted Zn finger-like uncharacterized protein
MKFLCPHCAAKYRISEDKFTARPGATLMIRCRKCSSTIRLQPIAGSEQYSVTASSPPHAERKEGTNPRPRSDDKVSGAAATAAPDVPRQPGKAWGKDTLRGLPRIAPGPPAEAAPPPAKPPSGSVPQDNWFVGVNGVPLGPITLDELRKLAVAGHVDRKSLLWRDGWEEWKLLQRVEGLPAELGHDVGVPAAPPKGSEDVFADPKDEDEDEDNGKTIYYDRVFRDEVLSAPTRVIPPSTLVSAPALPVVLPPPSLPVRVARYEATDEDEKTGPLRSELTLPSESVVTSVLFYEGTGKSLDLLRPIYAATGGACIGLVALTVPFAISGPPAALASGVLALLAAVILARRGHPVAVPMADLQRAEDGPGKLGDSI